MLIKTVALMLEKINQLQWRKLIHFTYTFTPSSSHQRVNPVSKFIVEPRLCFSSCPLHRSLSYVWHSFPEYCKFMFWWVVICTNAVSLFLLFTRFLDMLYSPTNSFRILFFQDRWIYGVYFFHYNTIFIPSLSLHGQLVSPNDELLRFLIPS